MCDGVTIGCATTTEHSGGLVVRDAHSGEVFWRGEASYTVRRARAGVAERAVGLPGLGELHVGVGDDDGACRVIWSRGGLDQLVVYEAERASCAVRDTGRICLSATRFAPDLAPGGAPTAGSDSTATAAAAPRALVVDGCADANLLLWSKVEGLRRATIGPHAWRERCVPVPAREGCELVYLGRTHLEVATNAAAADSFVFRSDGEAWRACFLEAESGAYALGLHLEDTCGQRATVRLTGHSDDLDD